MVKLSEKYEIKNSSLVIGLGLVATVAAGVGIYLNKDTITKFIFKNNSETIVNDVNNDISNDVASNVKDSINSDDEMSKKHSEDESENQSSKNNTTTSSILDVLVEENENLRNKD